MRLIRLPLEDMYLNNQLVMCKKILRKFEPAFRAIAKKIEPQVKKWFSYKKKTCTFNIWIIDHFERKVVPFIV